METGFVDFVKAFIIGIIEGITEWLPVSSTGHMLLFDTFMSLDAAAEFKEMFFVVIQLGAILAVVVIFWKKMWPFGVKAKQLCVNKDIIATWIKVAVACIPCAVLGLIFDEYLEEHFGTPVTIALMLIIYGIAFILVEKNNSGKNPKVVSMKDIGIKSAFIIGMFQVLSLIPGTSRSGATIIGALLIGVSRTAAAEFTFFLAVPTMLGASALKLVKFGFDFSSAEFTVLAIGMITAFAVSLFTVRFLMSYVKRHDFKVFGIYRIILGLVVVAISVFAKQ